MLVALTVRTATIGVLGAAAGTLGAAVAAEAMGDRAAVRRAIVQVLAVTTGAAALWGVTASLPTAIIAASRDPVRDLQEFAA